ncbi:MAG: ribose-phosphate pyrophosphokinase [Bacteroidales bacterium]|nr:ribose-phosphate pyrophosphokinase [Bacteroidales bacterium]MBR5651015.1 ribose-phosphate pyrophosphokinase [Bacteroidales bacterium]
MNNAVSIFAGRASNDIGTRIAKAFGQELGNVIVNVFSDGEFQPSFEESIRGHSVYLVQSTMPPADNLMELLMMVDAARRASAGKIVVVIPYFGFARQDRKDRPRVPIASKLVANLLTAAGIDRLITMDLHADQIQGFFDVPVDHIYSSKVFVSVIKSLNLDNMIFASPDAGGTRRAAAYAKAFGTDFALCHKQRSRPNVIASMSLIGDVKGKDVILLDDMIDTAGTITKAANLIFDEGARSVRAFATHAVLSGDAYKRIENSAFTKVYVTDSIPLRQQSDKIEVISTAEMFAEALKKIENNESLSSLFEF